jgi:hypothetical protein
MSVDERLREAFSGTDPSWERRVPDALAQVVARRRRETVVRRAAAAGAVAAAVAVAATFAHETTDHSAPISPISPAPSPSTPAEVADHPLDGTWTSEPLTRGDVRRAAVGAGAAADVTPMLAGLPAPPFQVVLVVDEARNSLLLKLRSGGDEQTFDEANVEVTDDQMVLHPRFANGTDVHSWTLEDGVLRLTYVSTTEGETDGVPGEAWQRLLYDSAAFPR